MSPADELELLTSVSTARQVHRNWARRPAGTTIAPFDPRHIPPPLARKLSREPGRKPREAYSTDHNDDLHAQYFREAILQPRLACDVSNDHHGTCRGTGIHTAVLQLARSLADLANSGSRQTTVISTDIRDHYHSTPPLAAIDALPTGALLTRQYAAHLHYRLRQHTVKPTGFPPGHPAAGELVALATNSIIGPVRQRHAPRTKIVCYADDMRTASATINTATEVLEDLAGSLRKHRMHLHPAKTRIHTADLEPIRFLGHHIYAWKTSAPIVTPEPDKATQLADKLRTAVSEEQRRAIVAGFRAAFAVANPASVDLLIAHAARIA